MDFLSLKSRGTLTLGFPPKNPVLYLPYLLIELFYIGMPVMRKGVRTLTWLFMHSEPNGVPLRARASPKMFVVNQDVKKRQNRPLSRGSQFVSGDSKNFVYAQLAL